MSAPTSPPRGNQRSRTIPWARIGAVTAVLNAAWFLWSSVIMEQLRMSARWLSRLPVEPWNWVTAIASLVIAVGAWRGRPRAKPPLLLVGAATFVLSGLRLPRTKWVLIPMAFGALMTLSAARWPDEEG